MKKATLLLAFSFLLAFAVQLSATPAPAPHMKCRLDAPAGKRASVQTTHIRKKMVKAKTHKPSPAKPQRIKAAKAPKAKKEKSPKQSSAKPAKQHTSKPPKAAGQSHSKKTKSKGYRHTTSATF